MPSCTASLSSTSMASPPLPAGQSSRPQWALIFLDLRSPDDLQLHADQPLPDLPAALSPPLFGWMAGERHPGSHDVRASLRAGSGCLLPPRRRRGCPVSRMDGLPEPRPTVIEG